jgi:hypothetical protein
MTEQEFRAALPRLLQWVRWTLDLHKQRARPVHSLGFNRLPDFYRAEILAGAKAVAVQRVPVPPLSALGLSRFAAFERMRMSGITYLDTFFVRADQAQDESLHFHELVHVLQWRTLGAERFLWQYADGLDRFGYRRCPLEIAAFELQARFNAARQPFDVEAEVRRCLGQ